MKLLILDPLADDYKKALESQFPEVSILATKEEKEAGEIIDKAEILFTGKISDGLIKKASTLQWIQAKTTGVDYLINLPSLRKEVLLTSTRGIHGPQMSEMAILLMLALNRNFPQIVRNQAQRVWSRWPGKLLHRKKVGILGVGVIGEEIAHKCKAFGMTVYGIDIVKRKVEVVDHFYGPEELLQVISVVDYFIIVAPLTPETRNMIGLEALSTMGPTTFLINLGRGEIVDEDALVQVLKARKIAGAALDVFWEEPLPKDHPLWKFKNVIITPHMGGVSDIYMEQVLSIFEENLRRFLKGERRNLINLVEW
ncbi:MAG: D-2-hydroxyacid dehydrogenase [Deltaproteobacteria bacterium]|nr:D-2-hydroxyacid dehydrogenase [Deltaproteobacteria bacterium]